MIFIESLAREFLPKLSQEINLSTVCLNSSNPVYLLFSGEEVHPKYVIRVSNTDAICFSHKATEEIHNEVSGLVPEPIILTQSGSNYISIQGGLKGDPWFQLASKYTDSQSWNSLRFRSFSSLKKLHKACQALTHRQVLCKPGDELRQAYKNCITSGLVLPKETEPLLMDFSRKLDELGTITTYPQHGDFCLNNLIIDGDKTYVIDFEDFGLTTMPLYDQFTLALSLQRRSPLSIKKPLQMEFKDCEEYEYKDIKLNRNAKTGLFFYHIMFRLGAWSKNRTSYRKWLLSVLTEFIGSHEHFFE